MDSDLEKLYETYYMKVYSFIMAMCGRKRLAEDITQETFFKAISAGKGYRGEASEFTWLCAIAKNLYLDNLKKEKRVVAFEKEEKFNNQHDIEKQLVDDDLSFQIHRVLHNLEEPYKEVFQLRVFGELSFSKIGAIFGKTENWARVTYHRSRLKIQERMDEK